MRLFLIVMSVMFLAGCSKVAFKPLEKQAALKTADVFPRQGDGSGTVGGTPGGANGGYTGGGNDHTGGGKNPGGGTPGNIPGTPGNTLPGGPNGGQTGEVDPGNGGTYLPPQTGSYGGGNVTIEFDRHCSDASSKSKGASAMSASTLKVEIRDLLGVVVCSRSDTSAIKSAMQAGEVSISSCSLAADSQFKVHLIANGSIDLTMGQNQITTSATGGIHAPSLKYLIDSNPTLDMPGAPAYAGTTCDSKASPLYIDFRADTTQTNALSSRENGIQFDILGARNNPAYTKDQISWFERTSFALLALPNAQGRVDGIDQLFGNNTKHKDGAFADNGFLALAKYDSNKDKVIDSKDAIFSKLRLWFDFNRDGRSSDGELVKLFDKRIVAIDLDYDPNYYERDQFGNEIKYKSVVMFQSGRMKSIFDVWFHLTGKAVD